MVHFLWKVGDWFPKWNWGGGGGGGGGGALHFLVSRFFLLNNQVIRIFRLKNCYIILRAVTYVIRGRMCFQAVRDQPRNYWLTIFLETTAG